MNRCGLLCVVIAALVPTPWAVAQTDVPDSAVAEIIRRGNSVTKAGEGLRGDAAGEFAQVMGVPEDDSHKWFITVITTRGCAACERLKSDWQSSPHLLAFAVPGNPKQSWAHYNVYRADDPTQNWRWKQIRITTYPTVLIQPPRNGQYGDASTVVMQRPGYDGNPQQLAEDMSDAIRKYVSRLVRSRALHGGFRQGPANMNSDQIQNYEPPFSPITPAPDSQFPSFPSPVVIPPLPQPQLPTNAFSLFFRTLGGILASTALTSFLLLVLIGIQVWQICRTPAYGRGAGSSRSRRS